MRADTLIQDVRYAMRGLRLRPAFTLAIVSSLALGMGANAAMFGIVDRLLFRPPERMRDPDHVHRIYTFMRFRGEEKPSSVGRYARFLDLTKWTTSFSSTAGMAVRDVAVGTGESTREQRIAGVSAAFFGFFDAPPTLGRYFGPSEDQVPEGSPVTVLSHAYWQSQFGGRRDAIGKQIQLGPTVYTIIGVAPNGFVGLWPDHPPIAYIPITSYAAATGFKTRNGRPWWETYSWGWMSMIARRKPNVSQAAADRDLTQAAMRSYRAQLEEQPQSTPIELARPRAIAGSIYIQRGPSASSTGKVATWVGAMSLVVLLVACANVTNLLLAQALRRRREVALRIALGANRARLASQLFVETILLGILGATGGLVIGQLVGGLLSNTMFDKSEAAGAIRDPRTILFVSAGALFVGLLTGIVPALQSGRTQLAVDLKAGMREGTYQRSKTRAALTIFQAALSVMLLVGAGLFVKSLRSVQTGPLGYDADRLLDVELNMRGTKLDSVESNALRERLLATAKTIPGVENAAVTLAVPFYTNWSFGLFVSGIDSVFKLGQFDINTVTPEYFSTVGTRLLRGRNFTDADRAGSTRVMIVGEGMAKRLWPTRDAIGECVRVQADTMPCTYVVGIAQDVREQSLSPDTGFVYYVPVAQFSPATGSLFIRTSGTASHHLEDVRRALQKVMPGASYVTVKPLQEMVDGRTRSWRLGATMFSAFGVLALCLAVLGLYSVITYSVAQRTHELGVRIALGARAADIVRIVLSDGLRMALIGVAVGGVIAFKASKFVEPLLFNVSARDPWVFVGVAGTLILVSAMASWLPARRAARVEPSVALRVE